MISTLLQVAPTATTSSDTATIIVTAIATIGAGGVVKLAQMWFQYRKDKKQDESAPANEYKDSLKERVVELEENLEALRARIEELITMYTEKILVLSTEKATLTAKLEAYMGENVLLRDELSRLTNK